MADFVANLFGARKPDAAPAPTPDAGGFADFASAASASIASGASAVFGAAPSSASPPPPAIPYTKWYRVWERTQLSDFYTEMVILPFVLILVGLHLWGTSANRGRARAWAKVHAPLLKQEFAAVGFNRRSAESPDEEILRENSPAEFVTYASGRQHVAFVDVKLTLVKRFNPIYILIEELFAFFVESMPATKETVEATAYAFDGKEKDLVPVAKGDAVKAGGNSSYDGFVWAVVHKEAIRNLREERYDLSLTSTKEHSKLPAWTSVMSENSEITENLVTAELAEAVKEAGDDLIALIVSDQPTDKPKKLNETVPRKRVTLITKLSPSSNTQKLFGMFLRLPDTLAANAHYRPEVLRRIKQTREEEIRKIKKVSEVEEAEARKEKQDKEKREKREKTLKSLSSEEQRKFLEKEREKEMRKGQKRRTMKA